MVYWFGVDFRFGMSYFKIGNCLIVLIIDDLKFEFWRVIEDYIVSCFNIDW